MLHNHQNCFIGYKTTAMNFREPTFFFWSWTKFFSCRQLLLAISIVWTLFVFSTTNTRQSKQMKKKLHNFQEVIGFCDVLHLTGRPCLGNVSFGGNLTLTLSHARSLKLVVLLSNYSSFKIYFKGKDHLLICEIRTDSLVFLMWCLDKKIQKIDTVVPL